MLRRHEISYFKKFFLERFLSCGMSFLTLTLTLNKSSLEPRLPLIGTLVLVPLTMGTRTRRSRHLTPII